MRKYIVLNEKGYPIFPIYFEGDSSIPKDAIEITDNEEVEYLSNKFFNKESGKFEKIPLNISLKELKTVKLAEVNAWTEAKITGGFTSSCTGAEITYDSDKDTQLTMQGIALNVNTELFAEKYPTGCPMRGYSQGAKEKTIYMLSAEQVMNWCADLSMHIGTCKQAGWAKQAEVAAAQSKEELEAIVLE